MLPPTGTHPQLTLSRAGVLCHTLKKGSKSNWVVSTCLCHFPPGKIFPKTNNSQKIKYFKKYIHRKVRYIFLFVGWYDTFPIIPGFVTVIRCYVNIIVENGHFDPIFYPCFAPFPIYCTFHLTLLRSLYQANTPTAIPSVNVSKILSIYGSMRKILTCVI